jgi:hypothetical protein
MCWRSLEYHHRRTLLTDAIREPQVREAFSLDSNLIDLNLGIVGFISCAIAD